MKFEHGFQRFLDESVSRKSPMGSSVNEAIEEIDRVGPRCSGNTRGGKLNIGRNRLCQVQVISLWMPELAKQNAARSTSVLPDVFKNEGKMSEESEERDSNRCLY